MSQRIPKLWQVQLTEPIHTSNRHRAHLLAAQISHKAKQIPQLDRVLIYAHLTHKNLTALQAFPHLLTNALKHIAQGSNIELEFHQSPKDESVIYICDFPKEEQ